MMQQQYEVRDLPVFMVEIHVTAVQAVCNAVDSVQLGLGLLSLRRRVYRLPKLLQGLRE